MYHKACEAGLQLSQLLCNRFRLQSHVTAELIHSNNLVLLLLEMLLNAFNELSAISVASACDYHDVFRVNAQTIHCYFAVFMHYPYRRYGECIAKILLLWMRLNGV